MRRLKGADDAELNTLVSEISTLGSRKTVRSSEHVTAAIEELSPVSELLDIGIGAIYWLATHCLDAFEAREELLWKSQRLHERFATRSLMLGAVAWGLTDNLTAIQRLGWLGLDLSARAVLRTMIEHTDLMLAMTYDSSVARGFDVPQRDPKAEGKAWSTIRPARIRRILEQAERANRPSRADSRMWLWRKAMYQELSRYSHPNWSRTIEVTLGSRAIGSTGAASLSLGGEASQFSLDVMRKACLYVGVSLAPFLESLTSLHGWFSEEQSSENEWKFDVYSGLFVERLLRFSAEDDAWISITVDSPYGS